MTSEPNEKPVPIREVRPNQQDKIAKEASRGTVSIDNGTTIAFGPIVSGATGFSAPTGGPSQVVAPQSAHGQNAQVQQSGLSSNAT